jgi:hypothetical protein
MIKIGNLHDVKISPNEGKYWSPIEKKLGFYECGSYLLGEKPIPKKEKGFWDNVKREMDKIPEKNLLDYYYSSNFRGVYSSLEREILTVYERFSKVIIDPKYKEEIIKSEPSADSIIKLNKLLIEHMAIQSRQAEIADAHIIKIDVPLRFNT